MPFATITLLCDQPPEADWNGLRAYIGLTSPPTTLLQDFTKASLGNPAAPALTLTNFPFYGNMFFGVTAYDLANNEGAMSNIISTGMAPALFPRNWP